MFATSIRVSCLVAAVFVSLDAAPAQSIWGVHGPSRLASNTAGPPGCTSCPIAGPLLRSLDFGLPLGGSCLVPGSFPGPSFGPGPLELGDITVNRVDDTVWVTDGFRLTEYDKAWATLAEFANPLPFPLKGLGYQAPGTLWITDGFHVAALTPPGACGGVPTITAGPFPAPFPIFGLCTDIDYDPCAGLVYISASNGLVASVTTAGVPNQVYNVSACSLLPYLSGLAVDTATPNTFFITDGITVTRVIELPNSSPPSLVTATTTEYAPCACWPWAGLGGPTSGLAFDATPIRTCPGTDPSGMTPPLMEATHEAISPNPNFGIKVSGAPPSTIGFLVVGTCLCTPINLPCGAKLCVSPLIVVALGPSLSGSFAFTAPLPGGYACLGLDVCAQFVFLDMVTGCPITSNALNISLAAP